MGYDLNAAKTAELANIVAGIAKEGRRKIIPCCL